MKKDIEDQSKLHKNEEIAVFFFRGKHNTEAKQSDHSTIENTLMACGGGGGF